MKCDSIKDAAIEYAKKKAEEQGVLRNSIRKGEGNLCGYIGELYACKYIKGKIQNTYEYDIVGPDGITWDVKTKQRTVKPRPSYYCSVADYNTKQKCDNYVFVSLENMENIYVLGWLPKTEFYEKATFNKKGEVDPTSPPNKIFRFTADCYNIPIKLLNKFE